MLNSISHITNDSHYENSNIFHWISAEPVITITVVFLIISIFAGLRFLSPKKHSEKDKDVTSLK